MGGGGGGAPPWGGSRGKGCNPYYDPPGKGGWGHMDNWGGGGGGFYKGGGGGKGPGPCGGGYGCAGPGYRGQPPPRAWSHPSSRRIEQEVEAFIEESGIDERAADALRSTNAEIQRAVMQRGDLRDARNPSSAVLGRIRDAQQGTMGPGATQWGPAGRGYSGGPITPIAEGCGGFGGRNNSGVFNAFGGADHGGGWGGGGSRGETRHTPTARLGSRSTMRKQSIEDEVEEFIMENALDERASSALRQAGPSVQRLVLDRGGLTDTMNPSSALIGRLRDAGNRAPANGSGGGGGGGGGWMGSSSSARARPY